MNARTGLRSKLRRLHLFEIEDSHFCPAWVRDMMTSLIVVIHRWFGTANVIESEIRSIILEQACDRPVTIIDLCSGSGGPMPAVLNQLKKSATIHPQFSPDMQLILTDLHPPKHSTQTSSSRDGNQYYHPRPVDARNVCHDDILNAANPGTPQNTFLIRTMVCSFHHMQPEQALAILSDAQEHQQPLIIFELTDGKRPPAWLWWAALIPNFFFGCFVSLFAKPMTTSRLLFSFVLPVIPTCFAWDGAVSVARAYGQQDVETLLSQLPKVESYRWKYKTVPGKTTTFSLIVGSPIATAS